MNDLVIDLEMPHHWLNDGLDSFGLHYYGVAVQVAVCLLGRKGHPWAALRSAPVDISKLLVIALAFYTKHDFLIGAKGGKGFTIERL